MIFVLRMCGFLLKLREIFYLQLVWRRKKWSENKVYVTKITRFFPYAEFNLIFCYFHFFGILFRSYIECHVIASFVHKTIDIEWQNIAQTRYKKKNWHWTKTESMLHKAQKLQRFEILHQKCRPLRINLAQNHPQKNCTHVKCRYRK